MLVCLVQVHVINAFIEYVLCADTLTAEEIYNKVELKQWGKE